MTTNQEEVANIIQSEIRQNDREMLAAMQQMLDNSVNQLKRNATESAESQFTRDKEAKI